MIKKVQTIAWVGIVTQGFLAYKQKEPRNTSKLGRIKKHQKISHMNDNYE